MQDLIAKLNDTCCLAAEAADGHTVTSDRKGIRTLLDMADTPEAFRGGRIADKIVGRAAAFLMIRCGFRQVYAETVSDGALALLEAAGSPCTFGIRTPYIQNRAGTGPCPMDTLVAALHQPDEAYEAMKQYWEEKDREQASPVK